MSNTTPDLKFHNIPQAIQPTVFQSDSTDGPVTLMTGVANYCADVWGIDLTASLATVISLKSGSETKMIWNAAANGRIFVPLPSGPRLGGQTGAFPVCTSNDGEDVTLSWTNSSVLCGSIAIGKRATTAI